MRSPHQRRDRMQTMDGPGPIPQISHAEASHARVAAPRVLVYSAQLEAVGGIESHVQEFCRRFASAGWKVTLVSSRCALPRLALDDLASRGVEQILNTSASATSTPAAKWLWTLATLARLRERDFDAVYVNGQGRNAATVLRWYRGRARTIVHHHTACDADDVARWPPAYRDALRQADVVVVCADFIRRRMQAALGRADVEVAYCFSRAVDVDDRPRAGERRVTFGYFGRLIPEKGIDWILRLAREPRLQGVRWRVRGAEDVYGAADFAGVPNVDYAGPYADAEGLALALAEIDCFCLFSTHPEGIPVALLETMAAGRPWIATPRGGIPELVHDSASCALVELGDYDAVVAACCAMRDRILAGEIDSARQRAHYAAHFAGPALLTRWEQTLRGPRRSVRASARPLAMRLLPARARQSVLARHYRARRDRWLDLYAHAPLRHAPGMAMHDLQPGDAISDSIAFTGSYEDALSRRLIELGARGGTLVDVGANLGYMALLWAAASSRNAVLAIEASPRIHPRLRANVAANCLEDRVDTLHCAVGLEPGTLPFDLGPLDQTGWGGFASAGAMGGRVVPVPVLPLDELCRHLPRIELLKIDVEGAEAWVIAGAERILRAGVVREIWFEENVPRMRALGIERGEPARLLNAYGYVAERLGSRHSDVSEWVARPSEATIARATSGASSRGAAR